MVMSSFILIVLMNIFLPAREASPSGLIDSIQISEQTVACYTGIYQNLLTELLRKSESRVKDKVDSTFNPKTGLTSDYAHFDGSAMDAHCGGGHDDFRYDAWRVAMNIAVDYAWFAKHNWAVNQCNRLLNFFHTEGIGKYGSLYTLDGKRLSDNHSVGLVAMNGVACLASTNDKRIDFIEELWNIPIPSGAGRYYDGLLYMLAILPVSGNFRIYDPTYIN